MHDYSIPLAADDPEYIDEHKLHEIINALCSTSAEEERAHYADQLKNAVDNISYQATATSNSHFDHPKADHAYERGVAVYNVVFRLHSMLTSTDIIERLGAIDAFIALVFTTSETVHARIQRTYNAIRVLFSTNVTDIATAAGAARLVATFSKLKSPMSARAVEQTVNNALSLIMNPSNEEANPQLSMDCARAAMVITEMATLENVQNLIFVRQGSKLRKDMWRVCWDKNPDVRYQGVKALQAVISATVTRASTRAAIRAMEDVMGTILSGLSRKDRRKACLEDASSVGLAHGSLCMLGSLLRSDITRLYLNNFSVPICEVVFPFQTCADPQLRQAVADILPYLVELDHKLFADKFLDSVRRSTLKLIRNEEFPPEERGQSFVSLCLIAEQVPRDDSNALMSDLLSVCKDALRTPCSLILPFRAVIVAVTHLARASRGSPAFNRAVKDGMLTMVFNTDFTNDLVDAVTEIGNAAPMYSKDIRLRLVHLIAATLKERMPTRKDGISGNSPSSSTENEILSTEDYSGIARTRSLAYVKPAGNLNRKRSSRSDITLASHHLVKKRRPRKARASPRDFFRQVPISRDLHRIDSNSILTSKPSYEVMDVSIRGDLMGSSSQNGLFNLFGRDRFVVNDKENSPCVALKAILNFTFTDMHVQDYISMASEFVIGYVEYNSVKVRALAVAASAKLMNDAANLWAGGDGGRRRPEELRLGISVILDQVLSIAIADPSTDVRFVAMRSLSETAFQPYILQPEMLEKLFLCLHDRSLAIRDSALTLIGKLSARNPAKIHPFLRKYLMHLLTVLRCDGIFFQRDRREATELIYTLVHNTTSLILPFTTSLLTSLVARLREAQRLNETTDALPVLLTLSELGGSMSRVDLSPYEEQITLLLIGAFREAHAGDILFKKAALRALTAFVQCTALRTNPYTVHRPLLSELIQLITTERDADVRVLAGNLLGSLGAVDPQDNKYAAIIDYAGRKQSRSKDRLSAGSESMLRIDNSGISTAGALGASGPFYVRHNWNVANKPALPRFDRSSQRGHVFGPHPSGVAGAGMYSEPLNKGSKEMHPNKDQPVIMTNALLPTTRSDMNLSLFSLGGKGLLEQIAGYCPCWARDQVARVSLVNLLDHPFTGSPDFFPSAALDCLHRILATPRLREHHREACQAVVGVLRSVGARKDQYLAAVVPRMLFLLARSSSKDQGLGQWFTPLQKHIMHRLADVISIAGDDYIPFTFDTVLLAWTYLENAKSNAECIRTTCALLSRLRGAIGDEFSPIISTVLPPLMAALAKDESKHSAVSRSVLLTLESFAGLFGEYQNVVLLGITKIIVNNPDVTLRRQSLRTMLNMLRRVRSIETISSVIHPLLLVLSGAQARSEVHNTSATEHNERRSASIENGGHMAVLAAAVIAEYARKTGNGFDVFVPVVTKALKASDMRMCNAEVYNDLKSLLMHKDAVVVGELLSDDMNPHTQDSKFGTSPEHVIHGQEFEPDRFSGYDDWSSPYCFDDSVPTAMTFRQSRTRAHVVEEELVKRWEVGIGFTARDWISWFEGIGAAMFEQSGCAAFRACGRVADSYPQFTRQLFNPAFLSCWNATLSTITRSKICESLEAALTSDTIPLNVLQGILNLYEFMDHDEKPLPAASDRLAATAFRCGAYAKALRYREKDYVQHSGMGELLHEDVCGESGLLSIYDMLSQTHSAIGTTVHFQNITGETLQEEWLEKLQRWDEALEAYAQTETYILNEGSAVPEGLSAGDALFHNKKSWAHLLGRLRCLNELGKWRSMHDILKKARNALFGNKQALGQLALEGKAASVAFDLGCTDEFEEWVSYITPDTYDAFYYNSLLMVRRGMENGLCLVQGKTCLEQARRKLDLELTARVSEGYPRAYGHVINAQVLVELDEIIDYYELSSPDARRFGKKRLQAIWNERLNGCKRDWFTWYRLLMIRALLLKPVENRSQWLDFAEMCRKTNRLPMAREALQILIRSLKEEESSCTHAFNVRNVDESGTTDVFDWSPESILQVNDLDVRFACCKHLWASGSTLESYQILRSCREDFCNDIAGNTVLYNNSDRTLRPKTDEKRKTLAAEVFSKLSKWGDKLLDFAAKQEGDEGYTSIEPSYPLEDAKRATEIKPDWFKSWHYWGLRNAIRFEHLVEREAGNFDNRIDPSKRVWHSAEKLQQIRKGYQGRKFLCKAIEGYFRSIDLGGKTRLEDTLTVLTLWFNYGGHANLHHEFDKHFKTTNINAWIQVVPQIIARIFSPSIGIQMGVKALLIRIGRAHPQIAVYPLVVAKSAASSSQPSRRRHAVSILEELKKHHCEIVEQSEMIAEELVRSAVLWSELWHERLEEASKLYFLEMNVDAMLDLLLPLHDALEKGAETICEIKFIQDFGEDLGKAGDLCRRVRDAYDRMGNDDLLHQYLSDAWHIYHSIFKKIQRHQNSMLVFNVEFVSSRLHEAVDLDLAIPGTYDPEDTSSIIHIQSIGPKMQVVQSKQRPRKMYLQGSNGKQYHYLLKGHEDLRQDERVMQVFGLINKFFGKSNYKDILRGAEMKQYAVIALSENAGLIGWVQDCDTMHSLVKEYREARSIMPNVEHKVMLKFAPEPDRLPLLHKVDLFEFMLQNTAGVDIAKVLWLRSRNSEMWLDNRNCYSRSLATTSMAGYLLGLGDRHPSNIMIERSTGKVLHIDFGDCFEVAQKREKYPEKVPFRLTRMLVQALEPCGVDGLYRHAAEASMEVMRQENAKDSLMAMMEAFVYDPLIRWKLIGIEELNEMGDEEGPSNGIVVPPQMNASSLICADPEMQEFVQSIRETGSLAVSVRRLGRRDQLSESQLEENVPGAIPIPNQMAVELDEDEVCDPADLQTPNEAARRKQIRALENTDPHHMSFANVANKKAQLALNRFEHKLLGTDFGPDPLPVTDQVNNLIEDARNIENLCALFLGWCAFW